MPQNKLHLPMHKAGGSRAGRRAGRRRNERLQPDISEERSAFGACAESDEVVADGEVARDLVDFNDGAM